MVQEMQRITAASSRLNAQHTHTGFCGVGDGVGDDDDDDDDDDDAPFRTAALSTSLMYASSPRSKIRECLSTIQIVAK